MSDSDPTSGSGQTTDSIRDAAHGAVSNGENIRDAVRDLVVQAFSREPLTGDHVRAVSKAVFEGAAAGLPESGAASATAMREVAEGLDEAVSKAAQASRLAIEEATAHADRFNEVDLRKARDDLRDIEKMTQDVLVSLAKGGTKATKGIFEDLLRHFQRAGEDTMRAMNEAFESGRDAASADRMPRLEDFERGARTGMATIAAIGSGILAGLSEGLSAKSDSSPNKKKP